MQWDQAESFVSDLNQMSLAMSDAWQNLLNGVSATQQIQSADLAWRAHTWG